MGLLKELNACPHVSGTLKTEVGSLLGYVEAKVGLLALGGQSRSLLLIAPYGQGWAVEGETDGPSRWSRD